MDPAFEKAVRIIVRDELKRELKRIFAPPKQPRKIGRPITHGRYSKASGSDGKNPVIGLG